MQIAYYIWSYINAETQIPNPSEHPAYAGYLLIPSQEIELPCIEVHASNYELAELAIDKTNCGALLWYPYGIDYGKNPGEGEGRWIIADHDHQGFEAIMNCEIGEKVTFHNADGTMLEYAVTEGFEGYIEEGILKSGEGKQFIHSNKYDLIFMTCYPEADVPAIRDNRRYYVCLKLISG